MQFPDTIYALATPGLPAGIAVVRISGSSVPEIAESMVSASMLPRQAVLCRIVDRAGTLLDRGLAIYFPAPHSFTGEDCLEFHLHGSRAVVAAVLNELRSFAACRPAEPGEFIRRAFLLDKVDLLEAEGLGDLLAAETEAQRRFAMANASGAQTLLYAGWRLRLLRARAMMEAELDFSDEGDVADSMPKGVWDDLKSLRSEIAGHIGAFDRSEILRNGYRVVLAGPPNVGKSSLLNALSRREAAIVSDVAGTTRDVIEVQLDVDGYKVVFADTAGIRDQAAGVEAIGIEKAKAQVVKASLVLWLTDLSGKIPVADPVATDAEIVLVGSKADQKRAELGDDLVEVSATTGAGIPALLDIVAARVRRRVGDMGDVLPSRIRHLDRLTVAVSNLDECLQIDLPVELRVEGIRGTCIALDGMVGSIGAEEVLGAIFSQFCIGK